MKDVGSGVIAIVVVFTLILLCYVFDVFVYKNFAPQYEQARYNTFKQSQAFNDSVANDVAKQYAEYKKASKEDQAAIKALVLQETASYDVNKLQSPYKEFVETLRNQ